MTIAQAAMNALIRPPRWLREYVSRERLAERPAGTWACWKSAPMPHPFDRSILDVACGFDDRLTEPRCSGCWRAREESAMDQLEALNGLGDAAHK